MTPTLTPRRTVAMMNRPATLSAQTVAAVVVTYNRQDLLRETLAGLAAQTRPVDEIFIVDNASTDRSGEVAAEFVGRLGGGARLISLRENTGGAGGFAVGIAAAIANPATTWVWVMDDDTVPEPTALAEALAAHARYRETGPDHLAVMGSRVLWTDGDDHPMNTPKPKIGAKNSERERARLAGGMEIRSISFVSAFLRAERIRELGLPLADYFLWNDDFEYSARLLRRARGLFVPSSVVTHKTKARVSSDADPGERFFFEVRNKLWVFLRSRALKPWEKLAYAGASVRRWIRTFRSSRNRGVLLTGLRQGLAEGLGSRPRPTAEVLRDAGVPADVLAVIRSFDTGRGGPAT